MPIEDRSPWNEGEIAGSLDESMTAAGHLDGPHEPALDPFARRGFRKRLLHLPAQLAGNPQQFPALERSEHAAPVDRLHRAQENANYIRGQQDFGGGPQHPTARF